MRFKRDSIDDRGIEEVNTSIDFVRNELLGLFNKTFNLAISVGNDNTVFSRILDLSEKNCAFLLVVLVEGKHVLEREIANNITVEDKEQAFWVILD